MRFWADPRTGANFLAQVRDLSGVDHLYASPDLQTWNPLALPTAPAVQAALLVAAALIGPVVAPTNWLPSQFNVGSQDNWLTAGAMYQEVINGSSLIIASQGSASITATGGGNKQTTQFVCTKAIPGTDTAVTVFAVLFDSPGVTFAPGGGPSIVALGAGGADYTIPSAGTITQGGRSFLIAGQMQNVFAPSPIPAGSVYQIQWTNNTPPGWTNATVLAMVLDVVGNYDILFGGLDNVSQGRDASPVTVDTGPTKPFVFTPPPPPYSMALQLMNVLTDGVPANLSVVGSNFTVPPGGPDPVGPQGAIKDVRGDFLRKQNGTYLVAVDLTSGAPAIARSVDGVNWTFTTLPNTARPTPGLTECDDGTVLVPSDGAAGPGLVFRSTDDGQSFATALTPSGVTTAHVGLKYFPGLNTLFAYVSKDTGSTASPGTAVYLSSNQGQSWVSVFTSGTSAPLPSQQSTSWMALIQGSTFWGVDSLEVVTQALFTAVTKAGGEAPAFWGRYIGSKEGNLSQPEVDKVLHKNNCKVLLIYNGTYATYDGKKRVSTYADGVFHANNAIQYIKDKQLAVPQNKSVWIYLDTEFGNGFPKLPAEFFRGWLDAMLGSPYGGAGGVYGNTIDDKDHNPYFNTPFCSAYNFGISFMQTDTQASCKLKQYFGNPVGGDAILTSGRMAAAGGKPGVQRLIETMKASESEVICVLWEITPGPNAAWRAGNWTIRLNVTVPSHFITWNAVEIVHTDQNCNGKERLGNLDGQSVPLIPPGVKSMVVPGIAPVSAPAAGDKVLLLLSFSNSAPESRSFGYTPDQLIDSPFGRVGVLVYANQPEPSDAICKADYRTFGPYPPKPCNAPTVIHQYTIGPPGAGGCLVDGHKVDYDLVNAGGLASMW